MAELRRAEQAEAAKMIGVAEIVHLDRPDGELECNDALRAEVVRAIRRSRPDLVLAHDPRTLWREFRTRAFLGHTDHRAAGQATLDAIYPRCGNPNFFPEQLREPGLELWSPRNLWLFDTDEPELRVDITDAFERKLEALRLHESQKEAGGGLLEAARSVAARVGSPDRPAEAFKPLRLR
jgi:LmbE family N-acetylglucosaminyl deacetylase